MTDRGRDYCDSCWALILDRGYVETQQLCDDCFEEAAEGLWDAGAYDLDVVLVERLIV